MIIQYKQFRRGFWFVNRQARSNGLSAVIKRRKKMNTNYKSKVNKNLRHIFSAICLLVFIVTATVFAQTPPLRANGKIAFASSRDGYRGIYVMNADGTNPIRLTNNSGVDDFPAWSPDGKRLAYLSQKSSNSYAIKLMNADGSGQTELTPVLFDGIFDPYSRPRWGMNGRPTAAK